MVSIISTMINNQPIATVKQTPIASVSVAAPTTTQRASSNLVSMILTAQANQNIAIQNINNKPSEKIEWKNDLRTLFRANKANILAVIPRTMNAKDTNGDGLISGKEEHGTFYNAIDELDNIKKLGINTLHVLPVNPPGKIGAKGNAGSVYAPLDLLEIDPLIGGKEGFKKFINECHKRNIRVMLDLPSCASLDLFLKHKELMALEKNGLPKTPQGWDDIRMFDPWEDETKRNLNPKLLDVHKKFVDMCVELGVDGIRADVARAKPTEFWDIIIPYSRSLNPDFAWLGETYTYEDASPQTNMPYDRPEDLLRAGFDSIYGQYHLFPNWTKASDLTKYVKEQLDMSHRLAKGKSLIGSFATHDDDSPMLSGGADFCNLSTGIQATLPMVNPYFVDGFQSGDDYIYPYKDAIAAESLTNTHELFVHRGRLDIFNLSRKPGGKNPEIGDFMAETLKMREKYSDILTKGSFIPLNKEGDDQDQIIAYARHYNGRTLIVIANRNINEQEKGAVEIPGLKANTQLINLMPKGSGKARVQADNGKIKVDLSPAKIVMFEVDTPNIENEGLEVYKQNL